MRTCAAVNRIVLKIKKEKIPAPDQRTHDLVTTHRQLFRGILTETVLTQCQPVQSSSLPRYLGKVNQILAQGTHVEDLQGVAVHLHYERLHWV